MGNPLRLARICWNDNGWERPSGLEGKSDGIYSIVNKETGLKVKKKNFENEWGFGLEEWLLNKRMLIEENGELFKYSFIEAFNTEKNHNLHVGEIFDLLLYTYNKWEKRFILICEISGLEVIDEITAKTALNTFKTKNWFEEMKEDLSDIKNPKGRSYLTKNKNKPKQLLNVRFNFMKSITIFDEPIKLPLNLFNNYRYILFDKIAPKVNVFLKTKQIQRYKFGFNGTTEEIPIPKKTRTGLRRTITISYDHIALQNAFLTFLQKKYGINNVEAEGYTNGRRIDLISRDPNKSNELTFYEIKVLPKLRMCIRESLGQLIEYSLYPNVQETKKLVLVSNVQASAEDKKYINHLNKYLNGLTFEYIQFDKDKMKIIERI